MLLHGCGGEAPPSATDASSDVPSTTSSSAAVAWLAEVSEEAGLDYVHQRAKEPRFLFPEIMGGGAAWLDFDGDGKLDLYLVQSGDLGGGGQGNVLYRNRGDGSFEDVTRSAGVGHTGYGMGVATGDYDGDGFFDLYVTNVGADVLYRNRGDGTFEDATRAVGLDARGWGSSATFFDADGDEDLDLFVVHYVRWSPEREIECSTGAGRRDYCGPNKYDGPAGDELYENLGGRFRRVTAEAGLEAVTGYGLGVAYGDFDLDGDLDLYVANDAVPNQLWLNDGRGRFEDRAMFAGCAVNLVGASEAGMGVAAFDLEHDGDLDLFVTHLREETNTLYVERGGALFEDLTSVFGLAAPSLPWTGFGVGAVDFDHDGELDLFVANGKVRDPDVALAFDPYAEPNQLFRGLGSGRFEELVGAGQPRADSLGASRAAAFADYDDDGDVDVAVVNNGGRLELLENRSEKSGDWLGLRLLDERGRDVGGGRVAVRTCGRKLWRLATTSGSYCASHDPRVHFGLGASCPERSGSGRADEVVVVWPGNREESFGPLEIGRYHLLVRGEGGL